MSSQSRLCSSLAALCHDPLSLLQRLRFQNQLLAILRLESPPEELDPGVVPSTSLGVGNPHPFVQQQLLQPQVAGVDRVPVVVDHYARKVLAQRSHLLLETTQGSERQGAVATRSYREAARPATLDI